MIFLDIRTIVFIGIIISVICAVLVGDLWHQNRARFKGLGLLAADAICRPVALSLLLLQGRLPDWLSIVLANFLLVFGPWLSLVGLERFADKRGPQWQNYALLTLFPLVHAYFTYIEPSLTARYLNHFGARLFIDLQCIVLLFWRANAFTRSCTKEVGLVFTGMALWSAFWISWLLLNPMVMQNLFRAGFIAALTHICIYMFYFLLAYSLSLMINRRLQMLIQLEEQKFAKAFHSSPYAISLSRLADGKLFEVNASFERLLARTPSEILGRTADELGLWANMQDRNRMTALLLQQGQVTGMETLFRNAAGASITVLLSTETLTINDEPCILASINDISDRKQAEIEKENLITEREQALADIKILRGLLPICANCKKIRDDLGNWDQIEHYIATHSQADFSHSICPACMRKLYPEYVDE